MFKGNWKLIDFIISFTLFINVNFLVRVIGNFSYILYFIFSLYFFSYILFKRVILNKTWFYLTGFNILLVLKNLNSNSPLDVLISDFLNYAIITIIILGLYKNKLKSASQFFLFANFILAIFSFYSSNSFLINSAFSGGEEIGEFIGFYRFQGFFGTPGYASLNCALFFLYFSYLVISTKSNYLDHICLVVSVILGLWTGNRSFIVAIILICIFYFLYFLTKVRFGDLFKLNRYRIFYFSLLFLFIYQIYSETEIYNIYNNYFQNRLESGFDNRLTGETGIFDVLLNIDFKTFFLGSINYFPAPYIFINNVLYQPHNAVIYFLSGYGIMALVLVLSLIYSIIKKYIWFPLNQNYFFYLFLIFISFFFSLGEIFLITPIQICFYSLFKIDNQLRVNSY